MDSSSLASMYGLRVTLFPHLYAEVVAPGSADYEEARRLQFERFASTITSGADAKVSEHQGNAYLPATEYAPHQTIPIVFRTTKHASDDGNGHRPDTLVGAARLELPGATFIEATMRLKPGSPTQRALQEGCVAEIGGFTTPKDVKKSLLVDILDTLAATILLVSERIGIDTFWIQPRVGFMSLVCASIPDLLPPYQFTYCLDIAGWDEESEQFKLFMQLGQKGTQDFPEIYQIPRASLEETLKQRQALWTRRFERRGEMDDLLFRAMWRAHRALMRDPARVNASAQFHARSQSVDSSSRAMVNPTPQRSSEQPKDTALQPLPSDKLAFTGSSATDAAYLRALRTDVGDAIQAYKDLSYDLLEVKSGVSILDIGCGDGTDVRHLSTLVGPRGHVVGVERNCDLAAYANKLLDTSTYPNATVFRGDAEHLTFPNEMFDRVRADRAVQHFQHPERAIAEMWRVLQPGGILTIVEPDWKAVAFDPASSRGGNDDATFMRLMEWQQRQFPHALIGRQLYGLLQRHGGWSDSRVFVHSLSSTVWPLADMALEVSKSARLVAAERPDWKPELDAWLARIAKAAENGTFFAAVPLFFAYARKSMPSAR
jgi:ubiquinone/menaquinone biosynthesis C-methylase UbiE